MFRPILHIGCGDGSLFRHISGRYTEGIGIDPEYEKQLNCIGHYYNAADVQTFEEEDAKGENLAVRLAGTAVDSGRRVEFSASGLTITFPGFLRVAADGVRMEDERDQSVERTLAGKTVAVQGLGHVGEPLLDVGVLLGTITAALALLAATAALAATINGGPGPDNLVGTAQDDTIKIGYITTLTTPASTVNQPRLT